MTLGVRCPWLAACFFVVPAITAAPPVAAQSATIKPVISEQRGLADLDLDGNGAWRVMGQTVVLEKAGVPVPAGVAGGPFRRPAAVAVLKGPALGTLTYTLDVKSTAPVDLDVRDVVLIVGYRSPDEFYYCHIARKTDANHNGIFIVNHADRRRLDSQSSHAPLIDQQFHRVRLERDTASGRISVYFDAEKEPFLSVVDKTLLSGRVGFGSFDETGEFRDISVTGQR